MLIEPGTLASSPCEWNLTPSDCGHKGERQSVILVPRNEPRLNEVVRQLNQAHHVEATVIPCDLGKPNAPLEFLAAVGQRNLRVDILVNNAGVMTQALSRTRRRISCLVWCGSTWRP
jgi:NAD(P)-dependent dehydrogenase (short-subunit alcohol dehydrogenase family)